MENAKIFKLIERLYIKSTERALNWEATVELDQFQCAFGLHTLRITRKEHARSNDEYVIEIHDAEGRVIEQISDRDFQGEVIKIEYDARAVYDIMSETFVLARRRALGTDQAIDNILDELE